MSDFRLLELKFLVCVLETIYRHTAVVDDQLVNFEIMDTAGQVRNKIRLLIFALAMFALWKNIYGKTFEAA